MEDFDEVDDIELCSELSDISFVKLKADSSHSSSPSLLAKRSIDVVLLQLATRLDSNQVC